MIIAVLSGKGGTGKTTISAGLFSVVKPSQYIDCDVEEPNGYIFLKPNIKQSIPVNVEIPSVDEAICTGCGRCARACQFNALVVIKNKVIIFPEICHHCGSCYIACKHGAMTASERSIGNIEMNDDQTFVQGKLFIGEPVAVPVVKKLKEYLRMDIPVFLDCSPGASCTVVQSLAGCNYCILVTEPTPFGLHDLKIAVSLVKKLGVPFGIVINKALKNNSLIEDYCKGEGIEILLKIPYSNEIAKSYSKGILPVQSNKKWALRFLQLFNRLKERV